MASFKLYDSNITATVGSSAAIVSNTHTDATITVTASGSIPSGYWVYSTGVVAVITINGNSVTKTIFGNATGNYYGKDGAKSVSHTVSVGKNTTAQNVSWSVVFKTAIDGTIIATKHTDSGVIAVSSRTAYTISYNTNGGGVAPSAQTKYYGQDISVAGAISRSGYTFQGWALSDAEADAGLWYYTAGGTCAKNENLTLYAVWSPVTYTVTYHANGGTGAPGKQSKTHGVNLTLSPIKPTRANYEFLGWATSPAATAKQYDAGGIYKANSNVTLYAVWSLSYVPPRINNLTVSRCDANGAISDTGVYARVRFNFACDKPLSGINIEWESTTGETGSTQVSATSNVQTIDTVITTQEFSTDSTYTIGVTVTDSTGYSVLFGTLNGTLYAIDFYAGGRGAAFGKPAELAGVLDIDLQTLFRGGIFQQILEPDTDLNNLLTPNTYAGADDGTREYVNCPISNGGTFTLEVNRAGESGQIWQKLTYCSKKLSQTYERFYYAGAWGEWVCTSTFGGKLLWSGVYYMSAAQVVTLSEAVSKQRSGIQLVFSRYSSGKAQNYHFQSFFVSKYEISKHAGCGRTFLLSSSGLFDVFAAKYLYIGDTTITGHDNNEAKGTGTCGIKYTNNGFVLRYVIGV